MISPSPPWWGPNARISSPSSPASRARVDLGRDADGVHRLDVEDLVVELQAPAAREHDVDLLGLVVAVREGLLLAGPQDDVREAGALGREVLAGEAGLLAVSE